MNDTHLFNDLRAYIVNSTCKFGSRTARVNLIEIQYVHEDSFKQ